jgi:ATP/ADP translocase
MSDSTPQTDAPTNGSYDQINAKLILVILVASAIFFGGVIVPGTMALNYYLERTITEAEVITPANEALTTVELDQLSRITRYRWVDQTNGVAAIPIDRAMEIYAARQQTK